MDASATTAASSSGAVRHYGAPESTVGRQGASSVGNEISASREQPSGSSIRHYGATSASLLRGSTSASVHSSGGIGTYESGGVRHYVATDETETPAQTARVGAARYRSAPSRSALSTPPATIRGSTASASGQFFRPLTSEEDMATQTSVAYNQRCAGQTVSGYTVTSCNHLLSNIEFLVGHRQAMRDDWQKSATATPALNVLSDGPISGHRVARGTFRDADGRLKGDIVVWADPKNKNSATIQIGISNNTPCKMHPDLTFYIGEGSRRMAIKTLTWGGLAIAPHDKRTFGPSEITNSINEPITFDGSAYFEDCQVTIGQ